MHRPPLPRAETSPSTTSHRRELSSSSTTNTNTAHAKKPTTIRPQRPAIHHRKSASAHYPAHNSARAQPQSIGRLLGPGTGPASWSAQNDDDDEKYEMATSFLQYCAMCEKQITVPDDAVLYCSERCRRKDSCKPLSASSYTHPMSPSTTPPSSPPMSPRAIVAARTPTGASPRSMPGLLRIPSDLHDAKSDLDPTEWKPVISTRRNGSSVSLAESAAWNYLCQFHPPAADESAPALGMLPTRRPGYVHRSSASLSALAGYASGTMIPTPPLTSTPTTAASSLNSNSDYIGYMDDHPSFGGSGAVSSSLTVARPLPPRHNPSFSTSAWATKGVELVVPHIVHATPAPSSAVTLAVAPGTSPAESIGADGGIWLKVRSGGTTPRHSASKVDVAPVVHIVDVSSKAH